MASFGFIILRHVSKKEHDKYWITCYNSIRKYYNNEIVIIDDNSNYSIISDIPLVNCKIIQSQFPKRGELLPYYYLFKLRFFKKAVILHDSMFINKYVDYNKVKNILFHWHFKSHISLKTKFKNDIYRMITRLKNKHILHKYLYNIRLWRGMFGTAGVISLPFLIRLQTKFRFLNLMKYVNTRYKRMMLERIFGMMAFSEDKSLYRGCSLNNDIHLHKFAFVYTFNRYQNDTLNNNAAIIKIWSGR